jgi:hypothetical protein
MSMRSNLIRDVLYMSGSAPTVHIQRGSEPLFTFRVASIEVLLKMIWSSHRLLWAEGLSRASGVSNVLQIQRTTGL